MVAQGHLGGGVAGDGLDRPQVAPGQPVGPGEASHAGAVEHVATAPGEQLPDPLGGVAFRLTGLCEVGGGVGFEPVGDVRAGLLERPEPVGRPHRSPVPGPPEQQPGPAGLGVLPQVHLDVVDQRGRDGEGPGRDALAGRLQRPDLEPALGLLHRLVDLDGGNVCGEVEVPPLERSYLT